MVLIRCTLVVVAFFSLLELDAQNLSKRGQRKLDKMLLELRFDGIQENLDWKVLRKSTVSSFTKSDSLQGYIVLAQAASRFDLFDIAVAFSPKMEILALEVLEYREEYGGEISSKRWLSQFVGKSGREDMKLMKNIDGISGATMSCESATYHINVMSRKMLEFSMLLATQ